VAAPCFVGRRRGGYKTEKWWLKVTTPSAPQKARRSHPSFFIRRGQWAAAVHQDFQEMRSEAELPLMPREAHPFYYFNP
jgi:hypothetical protein